MVDDVAHRHGQRLLAMARNRQDDIAFRDETRNGIAALQHRRDPALTHPIGGAFDGFGRVGGNDLAGGIRSRMF